MRTTDTPLAAIAGTLARMTTPGAFSTRRICPADVLQLEIAGVGRISFPVSGATARKLCDGARHARYGLRDKTLRDDRVRNTYEIVKSRIKIRQRRWASALRGQLETIRKDLGMPAGCALTAELHNMLVYGPGQFFVPHQDSEKVDGMVGTLVVTLPSPFAGGELVVEHHGEQASYGRSGSSLAFVAFYADCLHQVRKVKRGYRIVLTFNLLMNGAASVSSSAAGKLTEVLARQVRSHFDSAPPKKYEHLPASEPPDRLIYLLDHQYTQKSLSWTGLKRGDGERVAALREAAARRDCEICLALVDVHETWACEDDYDYDDRYRSDWEYGDEDGEDNREEREEREVWEEREDRSGRTPELTDIIESELELRHVIDQGGRKAATKSIRLFSDEVCSTTGSDVFEPFRYEHEGYMGNYGNTVDRWYHRAAVVLWPRERAFVIKARVSAAWAMRQIGKALKAGRIDDARSMVRRVLPFWKHVANQEAGHQFVSSTVKTATDVEAPDLAATLLQAFTLERLTAASVPSLIALLQRYGLAWMQSVITHCGEGPVGEDRRRWVASLPGFCRPLCAEASADALAMARSIAAAEWKWVSREHASLQDQLPGKEALSLLIGLQRPILGLLEASLIVQSPALQGKILGLISFEDEAFLPWSIGLLRSARDLYPASMQARLGLGPVLERCVTALTEQLGKPRRQPDDWSIATRNACRCRLCRSLETFLAAPDRIALEWPLAKEHRRHIHRIVDAHDLPVRHATIHSGSPHTLVLTKTKKLFVRAAAERRMRSADLRRLMQQSRSIQSVR